MDKKKYDTLVHRPRYAVADRLSTGSKVIPAALLLRSIAECFVTHPESRVKLTPRGARWSVGLPLILLIGAACYPAVTAEEPALLIYPHYEAGDPDSVEYIGWEDGAHGWVFIWRDNKVDREPVWVRVGPDGKIGGITCRSHYRWRSWDREDLSIDPIAGYERVHVWFLSGSNTPSATRFGYLEAASPWLWPMLILSCVTATLLLFIARPGRWKR